MESNEAIDAFGALAQPTRLDVYRRLVRAGPEGLPAGGVAKALDVPANTMSTHLAILERAGLVASRREGRLIYYAAVFARVQALIAFLLEDCCAGNPQVCGLVSEIALQARCAPTNGDVA